MLMPNKQQTDKQNLAIDTASVTHNPNIQNNHNRENHSKKRKQNTSAILNNYAKKIFIKTFQTSIKMLVRNTFKALKMLTQNLFNNIFKAFNKINKLLSPNKTTPNTQNSHNKYNTKQNTLNNHEPNPHRKNPTIKQKTTVQTNIINNTHKQNIKQKQTSTTKTSNPHQANTKLKQNPPRTRNEIPIEKTSYISTERKLSFLLKNNPYLTSSLHTLQKTGGYFLASENLNNGQKHKLTQAMKHVKEMGWENTNRIMNQLQPNSNQRKNTQNSFDKYSNPNVDIIGKYKKALTRLDDKMCNSNNHTYDNKSLKESLDEIKIPSHAL